MAAVKENFKLKIAESLFMLNWMYAILVKSEWSLDLCVICFNEMHSFILTKLDGFFLAWLDVYLFHYIFNLHSCVSFKIKNRYRKIHDGFPMVSIKLIEHNLK